MAPKNKHAVIVIKVLPKFGAKFCTKLQINQKIDLLKSLVVRSTYVCSLLCKMVVENNEYIVLYFYVVF